MDGNYVVITGSEVSAFMHDFMETLWLIHLKAETDSYGDSTAVL